jgi:hypothetical protein
MLNNQLFQKIKFIERGKFNHLINTIRDELTKLRFELMAFDFDTILNYHLS